MLVFDFCPFRVVNRFFHPRHNGQWPPTSKDFYPRFYPLHFNPILILEIEPRTSRTRCQHSTTRLARRRFHVPNYHYSAETLIKVFSLNLIHYGIIISYTKPHYKWWRSCMINTVQHYNILDVTIAKAELEYWYIGGYSTINDIRY